MERSLLLVLVVCIVSASADLVRVGDGYLLQCVGQCDDLTAPPPSATHSGMAMMGGHMYPPDPGAPTVRAFDWLSRRAGNGSFVVLKCADVEDVEDCNAYDQFIYDLGHVRSVTSLCFTKADGAQDKSLYDIVANAGGLFFTGGDQWKYISYWNNTAISRGISTMIAKGRSFGGSSAGLAIQGEYVYSAEYGSVVSSEALANPFFPTLTLTNDFLSFPYMDGLITDTHFYQRDRMGRLIAFMARIQQAQWESITHGVGVSEETAVLVDENGTSKVIGHGPAYFLSSNVSSLLECDRRVPLTYTNITAYKYTGPFHSEVHFDFNSWTGSGGTEYAISAIDGVLVSSQTDGNVY